MAAKAKRMLLEVHKGAALGAAPSLVVKGGVYLFVNWNGAKGGVHMSGTEARKLAALVTAAADAD